MVNRATTGDAWLVAPLCIRATVAAFDYTTGFAAGSPP